MADNYFLGHAGSDGSTVGSRLTKNSYPWTSAAENLAAGLATAQHVFDNWKADPEKRANMLNSNFKDIGVGCGYNGKAGNTFHIYWTADLSTTQP